MKILFCLSLIAISLAIRLPRDPSTFKGPTFIDHKRNGNTVAHTALDLQQTYGTTSMSAGAGKTISAVVMGGAWTIESSLLVYSQTYGLPLCTTANGCFKRVDWNGNPVQPNQIWNDTTWELEASMDIQVMHAIAPGANILLVCSDSGVAPSGSSWNMFTAIQYAVEHADYVSTSWGDVEYGSPVGGGHNYDLDLFANLDGPLAAAQARGVPFFAATGDSGYQNHLAAYSAYGLNWYRGQTYPASSPWAIAVGATTVWEAPDGTIVQESGWAGTTGGCSIDYMASPQQMAYPGYAEKGCNGYRAVPDISTLGDNNGGVWVYTPATNPAWAVWGGTSLSAPLMAARALVAGVMFNQQTIYSDSSMVFSDILTGSSHEATCTPGYDFLTGVGSWVGLEKIAGAATTAPVPATAAPTPVPPTAAPTPVPPTAAPTPVPPTAAPTPVPPTAAPTPVPPTAAPTPVPPTAAPTPVPPTAAPTPVPPTAAPTATASPTPVPPTAAPTATASPTARASPTPRPATASPTPVPATASPTPVPATVPPTAAPVALDLLYMGCYWDSSDRQLPLQVNFDGTIGGCIAACGSNNFSFAGLQDGSQCFCGGDTFAGIGRADDYYCFYPCSGNPGQVCGAAWLNSVYRTSVPTGYLGCHTDTPTRDFPYVQGISSLTLASCEKFCGMRLFTYTALQDGNECRCSNTPPQLALTPGGDCDSTCSGDPSSTCGGPWRNDVYTTPNAGYLGCYVDDDNRALKRQISTDMSVDQCRSGCAARGYSVAGSQYYGECWCGDMSLLGNSEYPLVSNDQCSTPCSPDPTEMCGDSWRNSAWTATL